MNKQGFWFFVARILSNKNKDLFSVRLGVALLLAKFGVPSIATNPLSFFIRGIVGVLIEEGIFLIDISIDSLKEGRSLKNFEVLATQAYLKASAKVYTEDEKEKIRQQYLKIISDFVIIQ